MYCFVVQALARSPSSTASTVDAGSTPSSHSLSIPKADAIVSSEGSTGSQTPVGQKQAEQHQSKASLSIKTSVTDMTASVTEVKPAAPPSPRTATSPTIRAGLCTSPADAMGARASSPDAVDTTGLKALVSGLRSMAIASPVTHIQSTAKPIITEPNLHSEEAAAAISLATDPAIPGLDSSPLASPAVEAESCAALSRIAGEVPTQVAAAAISTATQPAILGQESSPLASTAPEANSSVELSVSANDLHSKVAASSIDSAVELIIPDLESSTIPSSAAEAKFSAELSKTASELHSQPAASAVGTSSEATMAGLEIAPTPSSAERVKSNTDLSRTASLRASQPIVQTSTVSDQATASPCTSAAFPHSMKSFSTKQATPEHGPDASAVLDHHGAAPHPADTQAPQAQKETAAAVSVPTHLQAPQTQSGMAAATPTLGNSTSAGPAQISLQVASSATDNDGNNAEASQAGGDKAAKAPERVKARRILRRRQTRLPAKDLAFASTTVPSGWFSATDSIGGSSHGPAFNPPCASLASAGADQPNKVSFQLGSATSHAKKAGKAGIPVPAAAFASEEESAEATSADMFHFPGSMPSAMPACHQASLEAMDVGAQLDEEMLEAAKGLTSLGWQAGNDPGQYFTPAPGADDLVAQDDFDAAMDLMWLADFPTADQADGLVSESPAACNGADFPMGAWDAEGTGNLATLLDCIDAEDDNAISNAMDTDLSLQASTACAQAAGNYETNASALNVHSMDVPFNGQATPDAWCTQFAPAGQADANASSSAAPCDETGTQSSAVTWDAEDISYIDALIDGM